MSRILGDVFQILNGNVGLGTTLPRQRFDLHNGHGIIIGNLGIGTTNPLYALDTRGDINFSGILRQNGTPYVSSQWSTNGTNLYYNDGNVGIGTNLPQSPLHVIGDIRASQTIYASNLQVSGLTIQDTITSNTQQLTIVNEGSGPALVVKQTGVNYIAKFYHNNDVILTLADGGLIGINTATPRAPLDIIGDTILTGNIGFGTTQALARLYVRHFDTGTDDIFRVDNTNANTTSLIVDHNGNVGIGTSQPKYSLDVNGNTKITGSVTAGSFLGIATQVSQNLTRGTYLTGNNYNGSVATTWAVDADSANTAGKVVVRDASGNFSAGTITATALSGTAITDSTSTTSSSIAASATAVKSAYDLAVAALPKTGGLVTGAVTILANLTASNLTVIGDSTILNTITSNTEQMVITNAGTGPALKVTQSGAFPVAEFYDNESGLAMTIANDGNIGIGSTVPMNKLDVLGNVYVSGTITGTLSGTATQVSSTLTRGSYLTGNDFTGANPTTWAVDADSANTANKVVVRDGSGNFSAGTITASLTGTATKVSQDLIKGAYLTGTNYNGAGTTTWDVDADSANTANKVVVRDASGNFSAGTITASLSGTATQVSSTLTRGSYLTGNDFTGASPTTWAVDATTTATASKIVARDASGGIYVANIGIGTTSVRQLLDIEGGNAIVSGRIGIGTTNPRSKLHIYGYPILGGTSTDTGVTRFLSILDSTITNGISKYLTFGKANSTNNQAEISYTHQGDGSATNFVAIGLYGSVGININGDGNVGIGTYSPEYRFHVIGNSYLNGPIITNNNNINAGSGTVTATTFSGTATQVSQNLTRGAYLTGNDYNGSVATTWAVDADSANTASKVVVRDGSGNFSAGTITASLSGTATKVSQDLVKGAYLTGNNYNGAGTTTWAVDADSANTASKVVVRDGSGNFSAGTITATLSGTATQVSSTLTRGSYLTGNNFTGASPTTWAVDADSANTASKVVVRDGSGNFSAGTITASLSGTATKVSQDLVRGAYLTGTNYNGAGTTTWAVDATTIATASKIVARDASAYLFASGVGIGTGTARQILDVQGGGAIISGNVGIGTTNPLIPLHVIGTNSNTIRLQPPGGASGNVSTIQLWGTFGNYPADTQPRYSARITSGFQDSSTGIWGSEYLAFGVGNNGSPNDTPIDPLEKVRITSTGRVGIGTTNPGYKLEVAGDINYTGTLYQNGIPAGSGGGSSQWTTVVSDIYFTAGNVGIGTTAPLSKLHVGAYPILIGNSTDTSHERFISALDSTLTNGTAKYISIGKTNSLNNQAEFSYYHVSDGSPANYAGLGLYGGSYLHVTGAGNVGIGTTTPQSKFVVQGNTLLNGTVTTNNNNINAGTGTITAATFSGTATQVSSILTRGAYLTGNNFDGSVATTWAVDADSANTANKVVVRDASGNFSAGTITASLTGTATKVSQDLVRGAYLTGTNYNGAGTTTWAVDATTTATANKVVARDASAYLYASGVGIGTTNALYTLHVVGNVLTTGTITTSNISVIGDFVTMNTVTSNTEQMVITNAGTGPALSVTQTGPQPIADFYDDGGVIAMRIADGGLIGIGTTTPRQLLDVQGGHAIISGNIGIGTTTTNSRLHFYSDTVTVNTNLINSQISYIGSWPPASTTYTYTCNISTVTSNVTLSTAALFPPAPLTAASTAIAANSVLYGSGTYTVSVSSTELSGAGYPGYYAFDSDTSGTYWTTNSTASTRYNATGTYTGSSIFNTVKGEWIQLDCPVYFVLNQYKLSGVARNAAAPAGAGYDLVSPRGWSLFGASNTSGPWTRLQTASNIVVTTAAYTFASNVYTSTPFSSYAFVIEQANASTDTYGQVGIANIDLLEASNVRTVSIGTVSTYSTNSYSGTVSYGGNVNYNLGTYQVASSSNYASSNYYTQYSFNLTADPITVNPVTTVFTNSDASGLLDATSTKLFSTLTSNFTNSADVNEALSITITYPNVYTPISSYTITGPPITIEGPRKWNLSGSTDNVDWTLIESRDAITWTANQTQRFHLPSPVSYTYYRYDFLRNNSTTGVPLSIKRILAYGSNTNLSLLKYTAITTKDNIDGNPQSGIVSQLNIAGGEVIGYQYTSNNIAAPTDSLLVAGSIGIGTTNPIYKHHVNRGNILSEASPGGLWEGMMVNNYNVNYGSAAGYGMYVNQQSSVGSSGTGSARALIYVDCSPTNALRLGVSTLNSMTVNNNMLVLLDNGCTGIGITSPLAYLHIAAGTATIAPLRLTSGTNLTSAVAGSIEYDGSRFYGTTSGPERGYIPSIQTFRLSADGAAIGPTIGNFFGTTSGIVLNANGLYELEAYCYFTKTTAGTVTVTLSFSSTYNDTANLNGILQYGAATGGTATGAANQIALFKKGTVGGGQGADWAFGASASLTTAVNHAFQIRSIIDTSNGYAQLTIKFTSSAGTVTPLQGSYYKVTRLPTTNIGSFV